MIYSLHFIFLVTDNTGSIRYEELKNDLKTFIRSTMEEVVEKCFQEHFSRLAALTQMNTKASTISVPNSEADPVENHKRIDDEVQLHHWNIKLGNEDMCAKYVRLSVVLLNNLYNYVFSYFSANLLHTHNSAQLL